MLLNANQMIHGLIRNESFKLEQRNCYYKTTVELLESVSNGSGNTLTFFVSCFKIHVWHDEYRI